MLFCAMPEWILRKEILMSKYVYPAIFTSEPDGGYSVYFPDLEGCYTCGDTLADALFMAEDALALILYGYEKDQRPIPQPSKMSDIKVTADSFLSMVACDIPGYRMQPYLKSYCGLLFKYGCMRYPGISQTF